VDGIAFYIGGDTPHVWTLAEIEACPYQFRLPIFTRSPATPSQAPADIEATLSRLIAIGAPTKTLIALDSEFSVPSAYTIPYVNGVNAGGYRVVDYATEATVHGNVNPDGYYWGADITNVPHIHAGDQATQFRFLNAYDESRFTATLPLWDARPIAKPPVTVAQRGWNWCRKCQGLFWGPGIHFSVCPAGGNHSNVGSGSYTLTDLT
jgi:hypothetical protein